MKYYKYYKLVKNINYSYVEKLLLTSATLHIQRYLYNKKVRRIKLHAGKFLSIFNANTCKNKKSYCSAMQIYMVKLKSKERGQMKIHGSVYLRMDREYYEHTGDFIWCFL